MKELRFNQSLELRHAGGKPTIVGYAARFNSLSHPIAVLGGSSFVEKISRGAFSKAIAQGDVRALVNHDPSKILGRTKARTLSLREDSNGLYVEINPPDTAAGHDVVTSIRRGDLDGMSFGFGVIDEAWSKTPDGQPLRELRQVELFDVSVVTYPAYPSTSVAMRSLFPDGIPPNVAKHMGQTPDQRAVLNPERCWMSPSMQTFYRHQDLKAKINEREAEFERSVLAEFPDSNLARQLKCERELAEIQQDLALDENRRMKFELHERWRLKDDYARFPLYTDLELYRKKPAEKRQKDPWATRRLF